LTREVRELDLATLKIYARGGVIQFDTDTERIASITARPTLPPPSAAKAL
jgi:hypothetical protein